MFSESSSVIRLFALAVASIRLVFLSIHFGALPYTTANPSLQTSSAAIAGQLVSMFAATASPMAATLAPSIIDLLDVFVELDAYLSTISPAMI